MINKSKLRFIVDENNNRVAVQMDIDVFEAIEPIIEDHGLAQAILDTQSEETLSFEEALKLLDEIEKN